MTTSTPPQPRRTARMSRGLTVTLIIGLVLVGLVFAAGALVQTGLLAGSPITLDEEATAGTNVVVDIPNAAVTLVPSTDSLVHVAARGSYFGAEPTVNVTTESDVTTISGGCPGGFFVRCTLRLDVSVPAAVNVDVEGRNGSITATDLTGDLRLHTTNGAIETTQTRGPLRLTTTNGAVRVNESRSNRVTARTTNGAVQLDFTSAPTTVEAVSTNGAVTVRVPTTGVAYYVDARTTNGNVDTATVPSDRTATRTITAETTNGSVTIAER